MKNSNAVEFLTPAAGSRSFRSLSAAELVGLLCSLYLAFCFDQRRARFGAAVSDESIARYCRELAQREVLVVGCLAPDGLVAVAELHPCRDSIELALAGPDTDDRITIYGHLLQLVAVEARRRGCPGVVINMEVGGPGPIDVVRRLGALCS